MTRPSQTSREIAFVTAFLNGRGQSIATIGTGVHGKANEEQ